MVQYDMGYVKASGPTLTYRRRPAAPLSFHYWHTIYKRATTIAKLRYVIADINTNNAERTRDGYGSSVHKNHLKSHMLAMSNNIYKFTIQRMCDFGQGKASTEVYT